MEVVNVGTVSVDDAVELLLSPENLPHLVGPHGALCFALVRELTAKGFYAQLIENAATIDATTRKHIAFIVFYGRRSGITHKAGSERRPYMARYQVDGFSVSQDQDVYLRTKPNLRPRPVAFDQGLGEQLRYSPNELDRPSLSQQMGRAARCLMERYCVSEEALPCLLFVDGQDVNRHVIVRLSPDDPLRSLYLDALRSVSQEFAELARFWKQRFSARWNREHAREAERKVRDLPPEIEAAEEEIRRVSAGKAQEAAQFAEKGKEWITIQTTVVGKLEDPAVIAWLAAHPDAAALLANIATYQLRIADAHAVEADLQALSQGTPDATSPGQLRLRVARLEKHLSRLRQSVSDRREQLLRSMRETIQRLDHARIDAELVIWSAERRKTNLESELADATAFLRVHTPASLDRADRDVSLWERELRNRGYGDEVLTAYFPSAFPVIQSLQSRGAIGVREPKAPAGGCSAMRILFLAANPLQTSRLDLEEELRSLERELSAVKFRDAITLTARHAVRPDDLIRHIRTDKPNVIHFSGHGSQSGIILRTDTGGYQSVAGESLKRFLEGRGIELVVLNSCYSRDQAATIQGAVRAVVGTSALVRDEASLRFTVAFYRTLGDGLSIREAFRDGGDAVVLHNRTDVFHSFGDLDITLVGGTYVA